MENEIDGLKAPLPRKRKRCKSREGDNYYFSSGTSRSEQKHPCESHYKQLVMESKHLNGFENAKPKAKANLLNYQISIINDFNSELKETENALNIETLRNKAAEILSRPNNPELEMDFRATRSNYQTNSNLHDQQLMQAFQNYLQAYQQKTSLYYLRIDNKRRINLEIYNTETETKESKILKTPNQVSFDNCYSIAQLPNGKLFCIWNYYSSEITLLIDMNDGVEVLPSGTPCWYSSCIYFNNSVYRFGAICGLKLSYRFDFDLKRWIQLTQMPRVYNHCHSIIFNRNILISGSENENLLLYSIDIDSFSIISYKFAKMKWKLLINAEKLFVIEDNWGSIYESEIGSYINWRQIGKSLIGPCSVQMYCSYNKGGICIAGGGFWNPSYYKFDLNKNLMCRL